MEMPFPLDFQERLRFYFYNENRKLLYNVFFFVSQVPNSDPYLIFFVVILALLLYSFLE